MQAVAIANRGAGVSSTHTRAGRAQPV